MAQVELSKQQITKVVDLFAGAGGFSLAALNVDCEVVFAIENDRHAADTYKNNFCDPISRVPTTLYTQDIQALDPKAIAAAHFANGNNCDLLLGGPPCQGFSTHRINGSGIGDPRNALIYSYFDFVQALRPRAFLMENVPGLLWPRHAEYLEKFYRLANDSGYNVFPPIQLDARDYGVPQRRKRVFVLGFQNAIDVGGFIWPPLPTHSSLPTADCSLDWNTCKEAFTSAPKDDPNSIHMNHGSELIEAFKNTPANGGSRRDSGRELPCHKNHDGHKDVYGRIDTRKPAPTMTTACINPSKGRFVHPTRNHGITVRQAARIQTFPDTFVFQGGLTASGKQIGNAVPVKLGEILIKTVSVQLARQKKRRVSVKQKQLEEAV